MRYARLALSALVASLVVGGCAGGGVRVWDARTGTLDADLKGHTGEVHWAGFCADESCALSASADGTVRMWETATGRELRQLAAGAPVTVAALSPDGRHLAYVSRVNGAFRLHVMELASGNVTALTDTGADESPSFAPNGKLIVYATQQGGRDALMTTTLDGRIKARLGGQSGDVREPDWGPFQKF